MRSLFPLLLAVSAASAQYLDERLSFGHQQSLSSNLQVLPGWQMLGDPDPPQMLNDRIILTPPAPGNRRAAAWTDSRTSSSEWTAEFEFRATGPERGSGNLQIWYTKEGQLLGTSSIYTVGRFDGLSLVIDTYGGRGGGIRGFLNDGNTEYKNHHSVDSLAFGHCDYSYRNLGRPSKLKIQQAADFFEVSIDDRVCFRSDQIRLPSDYYFGVSAATAEIADSFEAYKFVVTTPGQGISREEPQRQQQDQQQFTSPPLPQQYNGPSSESIAELNNRLNDALERIARLSSDSETRHREIMGRSFPYDQISRMERKFETMERTLDDMKREISGRDYQDHLKKLQDTLKESHSTLLEHLPQSMNQIITASSPRMGLFLFCVLAFQIMLAGAYIVYKKRRANAPKKYL